MNLRIHENHNVAAISRKNNFGAFGLELKRKNRASSLFKRRPRFRHELTKLKFCHGIMKNHFAAFDFGQKQKNWTSSLFKRRPWFVTSLRNWNFAMVSWKIILQLLTSKIGPPALPFQMEAAVIMNSQSRNFVVVLRKIICSFWPQTEFVDIHSQENRASSFFKRRPRFFGLVMWHLSVWATAF